jgi:hypothetical protein
MHVMRLLDWPGVGYAALGGRFFICFRTMHCSGPAGQDL